MRIKKQKQNEYLATESGVWIRNFTKIASPLGPDLPASQKRMMNYYIINNPFKEALSYIPTEHRYFPRCIASVRTNPHFLTRYEGPKYLYVATHDETFSGPATSQFQIDDYRNPVCAALCLAAKLKAKKVVLFCCDDSFKNERPGAVQLENTLWTYPQQLHSHSIIDGCLHWLKTQGIKVKNCSDGPKYKNAEYITQEEMLNFFIG